MQGLRDSQEAGNLASSGFQGQSELLPPNKDGYRYSNSDPVTGQAAWYDLRVRIRKAEPGIDHVTLPQFAPASKPDSILSPPKKLDYGRMFRRGDQS